MKKTTYMSVELADMGRPKERPPKTNWKIELIKKSLKAVQFAAPKKVAEVVWHYFTMPGKVYFSPAQKEILASALTGTFQYRNKRIVTYEWGHEGPSVLLCHGWRSKAADFRRIITAYLKLGYVVHAYDGPAHGNSGGKHTALPEMRDVIKEMILRHGPFDVVLGYSMGGIASGIAISELNAQLKPKQLFLIAAPAYVRYFFKDVIRDVGLNEAVYEKMTNMVEEVYGQSVDYFDLREKADELRSIEKHMIYCEDDEIVPFRVGMELNESHEDVDFVQARGFGHYKIISHDLIVDHIMAKSKPQVHKLAIA